MDRRKEKAALEPGMNRAAGGREHLFNFRNGKCIKIQQTAQFSPDDANGDAALSGKRSRRLTMNIPAVQLYEHQQSLMNVFGNNEDGGEEQARKSAAREAARSASAENAAYAATSVGDYLARLREKYPSTQVTPETEADHNKTGMGDVGIHPDILTKMAADPVAAAKYEAIIASMPATVAVIQQQAAARGDELAACGATVDKNGNMVTWMTAKAGTVSETGNSGNELFQEQGGKAEDQRAGESRQEEQVRQSARGRKGYAQYLDTTTTGDQDKTGLLLRIAS